MGRLAAHIVERSIADLVSMVETEHLPEDVKAYISGPAVILDVIALY